VTYGSPAYGAGPYGGEWSKPKITYTRAGGQEVSLTLSQYPIDYIERPRFKKVNTEYDSGVVEVDTFNNRLVIPVRFELLLQSEADWIMQWFEERAAAGNEFTWYRFSDTSPGLTCIWNPSDTTPDVAPMSDNPAYYFTFNAEFWEVIP
jgi:hypothetical protein